MLLIGLAFFALGGYFILSEIYTVRKIDDELVVVSKELRKDTDQFKYKLFMGILSFVLGLFAIINNIIY